MTSDDMELVRQYAAHHSESAFAALVSRHSNLVYSAAWKDMSPLLEEAMVRLGSTERDALVLRFFEGRSLDEVGMALGASEDAAKKRVHRGLEKLRQYFTKRGVVVTPVLLAGALLAHSVQAAPVLLAPSVTAAALAEGAAVGASTLTLVKGALQLMAWIKAKTAIAAGAAMLLATVGTMTVITHVRQMPPRSTGRLNLPTGNVKPMQESGPRASNRSASNPTAPFGFGDRLTVGRIDMNFFPQRGFHPIPIGRTCAPDFSRCSPSSPRVRFGVGDDTRTYTPTPRS